MSAEDGDPFGQQVADEDPFGAQAAEEDPFGAAVDADGGDDDDEGAGDEGEEVAEAYDPFGAPEGHHGDEEAEDQEEEQAQEYDGHDVGADEDPYGAAAEEDPFGAEAADDQEHDNGDEEEKHSASGESDQAPKRNLAAAFGRHTAGGGGGLGGLRKQQRPPSSSDEEHGGDDDDGDEQRDATDDDGRGEHGDENEDGTNRLEQFRFGDAFGDYDAEFVEEDEGEHSVDESVKSEGIKVEEAVPEYVPEEAPLEIEQTYPEWDAAPTSTKIFSILEPSLTVDMEQPPTPWAITVTYHTFYVLVLLANGFANVAGTYAGFTAAAQSYSGIKTIAAAMFVLDLVIRFPLIVVHGRPRYVFALVLDGITSAAEVVLLLGMDVSSFTWIYFIPPLRSTRYFLFTGLFVRTETFRDINIAIKTVVDSLRGLLVFVVLVMVGILVFSTFLFITERGTWHSDAQLWYRNCNIYLAQCTGIEVSPFQSIPDAMWCIVQSMTTVGYGDATPTTTLGRFVTGCAIISGVFVIAFPSMVLIGNLDQSRRDFFAQEERAELEKEYRQLEEQAAAEAGEDTNTGTGTGTRTRTDLLLRTNQTRDTENEQDEEREEEDFVELVPTAKMMLFGVPPSVHGKDAVKVVRAEFTDGRHTTFAFMGNGKREVRHNAKGYWTYDPILQILSDPNDQLPLLSNVLPTGDGGFTAVITLVIDDPEAQALAIEAIEALQTEEHEPMAHADTIYGLDVTFKRPVPDVTLKRRVTIGKIHDHSIPICLELTPTDSMAPEEFMIFVRKAISRAQLLIRYCKQPVSSATWKKNVPITSVMLSTTPFIQDLRAIAVNVAPREFWSEANRIKANDFARTRRNVAFITKKHLTSLVFPIFRKVVSSEYTLRNVSQFSDAVTNMVILHCREMRKHDVAPQIRMAIYQDHLVAEHEHVFEVDVDYFRTLDWPLGTAPCEFSERCYRTEVLVKVADAPTLAQPVIHDIEAFRRADVNEGDAEEAYDAFADDF